MPLRIESVETVPVGLPFRRRYLTASGALDRREMHIVRIRAEDGTTGFGDAVPMSLRGGPDLRAVRSDLDRICAPVLAGIAFGADRRGSIVEAIRLCGEAGAGAEARSGVEIALLDLVGKLEGVPVWRLLGAESAPPVPCNGTIGADEPAVAAATAAGMARAGFRTLKIKVGSGADLNRMRSVRAACGPAVRLRIDANAAWSVAEAIEHLHQLVPLDIEIAEQPCASLAELACVRAGSSVPIVADESVTTIAEAENAIALEAIDAATLKLAKVGGVHAALEIAESAPSYLSSALDSALGIAAAAHAVPALAPRAFTSGRAHGLATSALFADNVADDSSLQGPSITLSDRPGLGVDVGEDAIERLRLR